MTRVVRTVITLLLAVPVLLLASPSPAHACSCAEPTPRELVAGSSAVFSGVVESTRDGDGDERVTELLVDHVWSGSVSEHTEIVHGVMSSACGLSPDDGQRLVVAAELEDGDLHTGFCSVSEGERSVAEFVAALGSGEAPAAGSIEAAAGGGPPVVLLAAAGLVLLAAVALVVRRCRAG